MTQRTGVVIVNYRATKDTQDCLESLNPVKSQQLKVMVVQPDSKSGDIKSPDLEVTTINHQDNRGYSWAVNLGIKQALAAGCKNIVVLNNDTVVDKNCFNWLSELLLDEKVGLVSPKIYFAKGREFHHQDYLESERGKVVWYMGGVVDWNNVYAWHWGVNEVDHGQFNKPIETDFATGCCVAFRSNLINKIGFWDERYFLYFEDVDWSVRAKQAGFKVMVEPKALIWHKNAGSTGGPGSKMHRYYQTRNRLLLTSKFGSLRTKTAVYRQALKSLKQAEKIEKQAIRDGLRKRWGQSNI